jgi:hypothetical protein
MMLLVQEIHIGKEGRKPSFLMLSAAFKNIEFEAEINIFTRKALAQNET